jgi:hypothetical protein
MNDNDWFAEVRARREALRAARGSADRRLIRASSGWGCSDCAFLTAMPRVGMNGSRSGKSRIAVLRAKFANHVCSKHPKEA